MKKRVEEMEAEAAKLRELQAASEGPQDGSGSNAGEAMETDDDRHAADERSIYVGNVRKFHLFQSAFMTDIHLLHRWTIVHLPKRYKHISRPAVLLTV